MTQSRTSDGAHEPVEVYLGKGRHRVGDAEFIAICELVDLAAEKITGVFR